MALGWAALAPLAVLSALPASALIPGPAQVVPGTTVLNGVSCPSPTTCQAVGYSSSNQGVVVPITNGTPGAAEVVPGISQIFDVSCPSATTCQVVGKNFTSNQGVVVTITLTALPTLSTSASSNRGHLSNGAKVANNSSTNAS